LPERLQALEEIAYNLRWSWDHETIGLFRRLDRDLWEDSGHNPVAMLGSLAQERLQEAAEDEAFLAHLDRVASELHEYVTSTTTWYHKRYGPQSRPLVAYFSMEFGLTECLPIYSGGLGILAGDHLKSASELGLPLVGVGLLYQKGYFRQYLTSEGWQQERQPVNDFSVLPVRPCLTAAGEPVIVEAEVGGRTVRIRPWRVEVGRVPLILLDTNIPENPPDLQDITDALYGGDSEMRIQQEIVLGVGGVRALLALDLRPRVFHMNEGHCAFLGLERIRHLMAERRFSFHEALEVVAASGLFTTHTPVPAGIDVFSADQMERYLGRFREAFGLGRDAFLDLGRLHPGRADEPFNMAVLAIRTASIVNGVSRLHAQVSRAMWRDLWPGVPVDELPISHITNGVHPQSWISEDMRTLTTGTWGRGGPRSRATPAYGGAPSRSRARSCGARTSGGASGSWRSPAGGWSSSFRPAAPARTRSRRRSRRSIPRRSPSVLPGGSPPTSGPGCCCATRSASPASSTRRGVRCRCSLRARRIRATIRPRR
jgi:starch phosphorylase